ncbi:MAG: hypothetical protein FJ090_17630, partial [Deltaproteobacteria bacterium]|nr:hypothetical protein [Deltaproteobacteria bacterium]
MLALLPLALAVDPARAERGTLAAMGEMVDGATVTTVVTHPEFERYTLHKGNAEYLVELTMADPLH